MHKERGRISRPAPSVCRLAARQLLALALLATLLGSTHLAVAGGGSGSGEGLLSALGLGLHWGSPYVSHPREV